MSHRLLRGRRRELEQFEQGLPSVLNGDSAAHAFVGEPGIGKITLATALCQSARQRGFRVVWGRAWEAGAFQAYWPWRQILDGLPAT
jgi:predicted ATPase